MLGMKREDLVILSIVLLLPALLLSQGYVQPVGSTGNVDWTQQVMRSTGIGAPNPNMPLASQRAGALRAAKVDAWRNLLETVKGVYLTSETVVENAMLSSDVISTRVEGALKGFKVVDTRYLSTGDVEVEVEAPLTGIIMDALLPAQTGGGMLQTAAQTVCPTCGQPVSPGTQLAGGAQPVQVGGAMASMGSSSTYTGLVVDARGLGLRPAMAPAVLDDQGEEVYGSRFVSREYAVDIGMAGYEKDINRASQNERVTNNPLIVKGVKASGPNKTDVVISSADAAKIHSAAANMNFLERCKVMLILD
ncbi:LPP20 family lipoprotein [candidate division KSB1 bacterium]|nr:LPP20 family lipoprotein [candidate division KSB1 bacterium]